MFGLNKNVTVEFTKKKMIVEVIMTTGKTERVVFFDNVSLSDGKLKVRHSAYEMFNMTKNKDRRVQRVWQTEQGYFINEKNISGFGMFFFQNQTESYKMKQNIFTKNYSWS